MQFSPQSSFRVGQNVRYYNSSLGCWVSATCLGFNPNGSMNLGAEEIDNSDPYQQAAPVKLECIFHVKL